MMTTITVPPTSSPSPNDFRNKSVPFWLEIHDPQSKFVNNYNLFLLFVELFSIYLDACYSFLPFLNPSYSIILDRQLGFRISLVRVIVDVMLLSGVVLRFRTAHEDRSSHVFGRRELVKMPNIIAMRYLKSGFIVDVFSSLPLPQIFGALYYFAYIDELVLCESIEFQKEANAVMRDPNQLVSKCPRNGTDSEGLLSDAYANNIGSRSFTQKYMFCFSWGLKTLSSMGQNLGSNAFILDNIVSLIAIILGLVLFADLIARMQTCMQSVGEHEEQQMIRQRELEEWAKHHQLPAYLKARVQQTMQFQFLATKGIDDEAILDSLPLDLCCEIRRYMYLGLIKTLPVFEEMDDHVLHAICGHLRAFSAAEGMFIMLEGDPVDQILFIFSGQLEIFSIDDGSSRFSTVGPGGICGHELLAWCSPSSTSTEKLPSSTCTVKCMTRVEAFSLRAQDVKLLDIQLNYDGRFFDALSRHSS